MPVVRGEVQFTQNTKVDLGKEQCTRKKKKRKRKKPKTKPEYYYQRRGNVLDTYLSLLHLQALSWPLLPSTGSGERWTKAR